MSTFEPDSPLVHAVAPSPNHDARSPGMTIDTIILHSMSMATDVDAIQILCAADPGVSAHYLLDEHGRIIQLVPEIRRARHAGQSMWAGSTDLNSRSIGIEVSTPGQPLGYAEFNDRQVDAVVALCREIIARYGIGSRRILAHSDVAPSRKQDPGEKFPWERLHASGVGHWAGTCPIQDGDMLARGDSGARVASLQADLARYGYGVPSTGHYDDLTHDVVTAFQRHFRPARVDGIADVSTVSTLRNLLARRP
jgi:N-acetylmuramoyl-L-alanine amidase